MTFPSSNCVPTPKAEAPPIQEEQRVITNNLSARALLDIVALQSCHTHKDPVVLLERLPEMVIEESQVPLIRPKTPPPTKIKFSNPNRNGTMLLRPRNKREPLKRIVKGKVKQMRKKVLKRKRRPVVESSDVDDSDEALGSVKRRREGTAFPERGQRVTRSRVTRRTTEKPVEAEPQPSPESTKRQRKKPAQFKRPVVPTKKKSRDSAPVSCHLDLRRRATTLVSIGTVAQDDTDLTDTKESLKSEEILDFRVPPASAQTNHINNDTTEETRLMNEADDEEENMRLIYDDTEEEMQFLEVNEKEMEALAFEEAAEDMPAQANDEASEELRKTTPIDEAAADLIRQIEMGALGIGTEREISEVVVENAAQKLRMDIVTSMLSVNEATEEMQTETEKAAPAVDEAANESLTEIDKGTLAVDEEARQLRSEKEMAPIAVGEEAEEFISQTETASLPVDELAVDLCAGDEREADEVVKLDEARPPLPCPSGLLHTVSDVVTAPPELLSTMCQKCANCRRVNVARRISTFVDIDKLVEIDKSQRATTERDGDIYEFREEEPGLDLTRPGPSKRKFYFDLIPAARHIIELNEKQVPKVPSPVMQARLVEKSKSDPIPKINLIKHENVMLQILKLLLEGENVPSVSEVVRVKDEDDDVIFIKSIPASPTASTSAKVPTPASVPTPVTAPAHPPQNPPKDQLQTVEAPVFRPTEAEFVDPIAYFEKIAPIASKFGLCKIIAPDSFKPKCVLNDEIKFNVSNCYIARLFSRWGPAAREISTMKAYLATQNVTFSRVPLLDSLEVNLPKLYTVVQRNGGLKQVIEKKRWGRVAEEMRFSKGPNTEKILDSYYVKYLLPYDTASNDERAAIMSAVEKAWFHKLNKLINIATNPLHIQKKHLGESDSSDDDAEDNPPPVRAALNEAEECVVKGRNMNLNGFKKVAAQAMSLYMGNNTSISDVEKEYWRLVLFGTEHVCVNAAAIDSDATGLGFSKVKTDAEGRHPWNLKMLSSNTKNVLRCLGAVLGVTVPTVHLGMVFATSCWHRDPHGLPWMEYMHEGSPKIWYGIPDEQSDRFRKAVELLCPTSCLNKSIWLSTDITMIPPKLLREHNVSLAQTVQNPGEFVLVFPKAYSSSICTGFTVTESAYFANAAWLSTVHPVFQELRASCEPTTFSLEQLLIGLAKTPKLPFNILKTVHSLLHTIVEDERRLRLAITDLGIPSCTRNKTKQHPSRAWNVRDQDECAICRSTLYLSEVKGVLNKRSALCLMHGHRLLENRNKSNTLNKAGIELVVYYSDKALDTILTKLKNSITD